MDYGAKFKKSEDGLISLVLGPSGLIPSGLIGPNCFPNILRGFLAIQYLTELNADK